MSSLNADTVQEILEGIELGFTKEPNSKSNPAFYRLIGEAAEKTGVDLSEDNMSLFVWFTVVIKIWIPSEIKHPISVLLPEIDLINIPYALKMIEYIINELIPNEYTSEFFPSKLAKEVLTQKFKDCARLLRES